MTVALFDIEEPDQLLSYLRSRKLISAVEKAQFVKLSGGVSNRVVLVSLESGTQWIIKQALAKLRVAVDWFSNPERIHREAEALRALEQIAPPGTITPFVYEDHAEHLLIMDAVPQPHYNWKTLLMKGDIQTDHIKQFSSLIATIHRRSIHNAKHLSAVFADRTYFETLRLEPYYLYSATRVPAAASFIQKLCEETRQRQLALVHGDYSPKNVLIRRSQLILLDHEVVHWGDPAFDLGFALTHFLSKAHYLKSHQKAFGEAANLFWSNYQKTFGKNTFGVDFEQYVVRHILACLLARVAGRSPLEYLNDHLRTVQQDVVCSLIERQPEDVPQLIDLFLKGVRFDH